MPIYWLPIGILWVSHHECPGALRGVECRDERLIHDDWSTYSARAMRSLVDSARANPRPVRIVLRSLTTADQTHAQTRGICYVRVYNADT
eukprot:783847-Pleurochrysis_carterae.AAC.3